jgi:hypothetical protein
MLCQTPISGIGFSTALTHRVFCGERLANDPRLNGPSRRRPSTLSDVVAHFKQMRTLTDVHYADIDEDSLDVALIESRAT